MLIFVWRRNIFHWLGYLGSVPCLLFKKRIVSTSTVTIVQVHVGKVQLGDYSFLYYLSTSEVHRPQYYSTKSCITQWKPGVGVQIEDAWRFSGQILASSYLFLAGGGHLSSNLNQTLSANFAFHLGHSYSCDVDEE